jgi:hypothetical protein
MRSCSSGTASRATQAGAVNSSAKTVARGRSVRLKARADEMQDVAGELHAEPARSQAGPQMRPEQREGQEDEDPHRIAGRQDLEHREDRRERTHRNRGGGEGQESAAHPEDDGEEAAMGHGETDHVNASD